jgi:sulfite reductase (NADPH) flavoprotein alpha-component
MSQAPIPSSAPFSEDEIAILNRVVGPASEKQRAWLAGFLAGLDAAGGGAPQTASAPKASEPLTILYATESGNAEALAGTIAKSAKKRGFKPSLIDMADLDTAELAGVKKLLVVAATWGEGDPPSRAVHGYEALMSDAAPRLEGLEFGVLALGDTAYVEFCQVGRLIDERLEALGAKRVVDRVDCDLDYEGPATSWIDSALETIAPAQTAGTVIEVDFGARAGGVVETGPVEGRVVDHVNLNSSRSGKETYHLALGFDAVPAYEPGDALDLYPENDPKVVEGVLEAAGHAANETLHDDFVTARDITTLSVKTLETYAAATGHKEVRDLIESGQARDWIAGRQLVDLLEAYPAEISAETLHGLTRPLAPRAYSIASSRKEVEDEIHLLIARVQYETHGRAREGVTSGWVASRLRKGSKVKARLKPNKHFRLPDPDRDIIMVGPGTGVAPFRAFVQERRAIEAKGRSWLFFGDRRFTHDFLYQLEWQDALEDGSLDRIDVAFSRDAPQKVYVQHRLHAQRRDLVDWLDNGAHFYVCGDANAMAKDVRAALVRAFADVKNLNDEAAEAAVRALETGKRYLQDVY